MPNPIAVYQPTVIQKLLGRHYKYIQIIRFYQRAQLAYNANSFFHSLSSVVAFVTLIATWYFIDSNSQSNNFGQILTYFYIGYLYSSLTPMWISEMLGYRIHSGSISNDLLRPTNIFAIAICEMLGRGVLVTSVLILIPYLALLPFIWSYLSLPTSIINYLMLLAFLPLTFVTKFLFDFIIGCTSFWVVENGGIIRFYFSVMTFLDGSKIPLNLIANFSSLVLFSPFAFYIFYPIQLFQNPDWLKFFSVYLGGITWCVVLYFLAKWVFKMGLKKNEAVGL